MKVLEKSPFPAVFLYLSQATTLSGILGAFGKLRKAAVSLASPSIRPSVRMEQLGSNWTDFHEILYLRIFRKSVDKFKFCYLIRITGTLYEDLKCAYNNIRSVLLRVRNVSNKNCRGNQNTHFKFNNFFFCRKSCRL